MIRMLGKALTIFAIFAGMILAQETAQAQAFEKTPEIVISGLSRLQGQKITLMYVVGSKGLLTTEDLQVDVNAVKSVLGALSVDSAVQSFSPVSLKKEGFRPTYNYLLVIVHRQAEFFWKNVNQSIPSDPRVSDVRSLSAKSFEFSEIVSISSLELKKLEREQGTPGRVEISLQ